MTAITLTPQAKLKYVAQKLGIRNLDQMQGSTSILYDSQDLGPLPGGGSATFFGENSRTYPNTNVGDNYFEVGEALAIEQIAVFGITSGVSGLFSAFVTPPAPSATRFNLSLRIAEQRVIKRVPINQYNMQQGGRSGTEMWVLALQVPIVIPPQLRYSVELENLPVLEDAQGIGVALYGTGVLTNLQTTL